MSAFIKNENKIFNNSTILLKLVLFFSFITSIKTKLFSFIFSKFFELNNGNYLICTKDKIYIYDSNLENKLYELNVQDKVNSKEDFFFVTSSQYSEEEGGGIIVLYKNSIYYLVQENKKNLSHKIDLETKGFYYTLVPYKIKDKLFFIIGFVNEESKININIYQIENENNKISLKSSNIPEMITFSGKKSSRTLNGFSCNIMKSKEYGEVLTCFYILEDYLGISSFNIKSDFSVIQKISNLNFKDRLPGYIFSKISSDKSKALICYIRNITTFCNKYDINLHELSDEIKYIDSCSMKFSNINLFYLKKNDEYILSCYDLSYNFTFVKFDKNMNIIYYDEKNNVIQYKYSLKYKCYYLKFYTIINLNNKYTLMIDSGCTFFLGFKEGTTDFDLSEILKQKNIISHITDLISYSYSYFSSSFITSTTSLSSIPIISSIDNINSFSLSSTINNSTHNKRFYYDDITKEKIVLEIDERCPEKFLYESKDNKECIEACNYNELINNKCFINNLNDNNIENITQDIRKILNITKNDSNFNIVIEGANAVYQIISSKNMNENFDKNLSILDLGECENELKRIYNIDYLLVLKIDTIINSVSTNIINYEIYNPYNFQLLNLSYCDNILINTYSPYNPSESSLDKIIKLNEYGYDLYDLNGSFYQDICAPFTSDDGTDITLSDRLINYYENISLCEGNCKYLNYYLDTKKVLCECYVKKEININVNSNKDYFIYFINITNFSNIKVLKCYKLVFSKFGQINNIGSYIFIGIIFLYIIIYIIFEINQIEKIARILRIVIENKYNKNKFFNNQFPPIKKGPKYESSLSIFDLSKLRKSMKKKNVEFSKETNLKMSVKGNLLYKNNKKKSLRSSMKNCTGAPKKISFLPNQEKSSHSLLNKISQSTKTLQFVRKKKAINKKKDSIKSSKSNKSIKSIKSNKSNKTNNLNQYNFNDEELNSLEYEEAIIYDNRTYFKYYCSLLKLKHLIFFTFVLKNDYNLFIIKLALFLFSFSSYFSINLIFFFEINIHEMYEGKGKMNYYRKLPYIIYSTIISSLITYTNKKLALSNKDMLRIKKIVKKEEAIRESTKLVEKLKIKFRLFFIISFLFLVFFWYFMSAFCAVYKNTQKSLIDNILFSFILSLLYPFGINLLPGFFRIPALKSKKNKCLYKFSNILELL